MHWYLSDNLVLISRGNVQYRAWMLYLLFSFPYTLPLAWANIGRVICWLLAPRDSRYNSHMMLIFTWYCNSGQQNRHLYCNSGMDKAFEVNVKACTMLLKHSVPLLSQSSQGSVINVSSINAKMALEGFVPYAMTKAAMLQVTRNAAVDLGPKGIRWSPTLSFFFFLFTGCPSDLCRHQP